MILETAVFGCSYMVQAAISVLYWITFCGHIDTILKVGDCKIFIQYPFTIFRQRLLDLYTVYGVNACMYGWMLKLSLIKLIFSKARTKSLFWQSIS